MSEFGRDPNDWGDWFGCDNSHPLFHFVLPDRYIRRYPPAPMPDPKVQVIVPANPKVFPVSRVQRRFYTDRFGYFTSACSATIYRDDLLFPGEANQHMFVCEPAYNLLHHEVLRDQGVSYSAVRPADEQAREFLASEDQWFRPVMARTGPDGALWVVDMYRYMIEHPDWLPPEGKKALAPYYRDGANRGRIYRIFQKGHRPRTVLRLDKLSIIELVAAMDSPNGTLRDMVQKQLLWRADTSALQPLTQMARSSKNAAVRVQALYTIAELHGDLTELLAAALHDPQPQVRRNALVLCEGQSGKALISQALKLNDDPDPKVRLQLACSLGEWQGSDVEETVRKMAQKADDPYIAAALLTGGNRHIDSIVGSLEQSGRCDGPLFEGTLFCMVATNRHDDQARLLKAVLSPANGSYTTTQFRIVGRYLREVKANGAQVGADTTPIIDAARACAVDEREPAERRAAAVALLGKDDIEALAGLLTPKAPVEVQTAAVATLARSGDDEVPQLLTRDWSSRSPAVRTASMDVLLAREPWAFALVKAAQEGTVPPTDFDSARRERLLNFRSARVRSMAKDILGNAPNPLRRQVIDSYRSALKLEGDANRGQALFTQNCAVCHRKNGLGADIGPDLNSVAAWQSEALLTAILDPSREVQPQYLAYTATLTDGDAVYGLIAEESGNSVTMKGLDGKSRTLVRSQIKSLAGTNRSLMPDGLESVLSPQGMADVIRFLQNVSAP